MRETVATAVASKSESFYAKLSSNDALSNLVMGFLGNIIVMCAKRGKAVAAVRCGPIVESLGDFRFKLDFLPVLIPTTQLWGQQDEVKHYVAAKSASMARCFDVNPSLSKTFRDLVETIERYCKHKGIPFRDFRIKKAYVTSNDMFVLRSGGISLDAFKGKGNY